MNKNMIICIISLLIFTISCSSKDDKPVSRINDARIIFAIGDVKVKLNNIWNGAREEMKLTESNEITTGPGAQCNILIGTESFISMKENTHIVISTLFKDITGLEDNTLELKSGKSIINPKKLLKGDSFKIKTPTAIAAVRGTQFTVESQPEGNLKVAVVEGKVELKRRVPALENVEKELIGKSEVLSKLSDKVEEQTVVLEKDHSGFVNNSKAQIENKVIEDAINKHGGDLKESLKGGNDKKETAGEKKESIIRNEKAIEKALSSLEIMKETKNEEKQITVKEKIEVEDKKDVKELNTFIDSVKDKIKSDEAEKKKAEITIKSAVSGSSIFVNSRLIGQDIIKLNPLPGANMNITVTANGYEEYKTTLKFTEGEKKEINIELVRNPEITIVLPVKNGKIFINSIFVGKERFTYSAKAGTKILIEVDADGFKKYSMETAMDKGEARVLHIPLEKVKDLDRVRWSEKLGAEISIKPVFHRERLIVSTNDGFILALSRDGTRIWMADLKRRIESTPVIFNENIYVATTSGDFYSIRFNDGAISWKKKIFGSLLFGSRPVITDRNIFLATSYGRIYSMDLMGNEIWSKDIKNGIYSSPAYSDGVIYVGAEDNKLYAVNSSKGDILWSFKLEGRIVSSSPVVENRILFIGCYSGTFYAIDIDKGKEKWKFKTGDSVFSTPVISRGKIYFGSNDGFLYSVSLNDGSLYWKFNTGNKVIAIPEVRESMIYITSGNQLFALNTESGKVQWSHAFASSVKSSATAVDNDIYIGMDNGEVASVRDSLKDVYR